MANTDFQSVDEYLATQPPASQRALERVRSAIRKAVPDAEEMISYQIPAYRLGGRRLIYFAGWTQHYSLYPVTAQLVHALSDQLAPYAVGKGTIRFPLSQPVPCGSSPASRSSARTRSPRSCGRSRPPEAPEPPAPDPREPHRARRARC